MMMMMMMMMMNCFCGMVYQRKAFSLISSRNRYQRSSTSWISSLTVPRTWIQNLFEWSCAIVITTTARRQNPHKRFKIYTKDAWLRVPILWNQYIFIKSVYQNNLGNLLTSEAALQVFALRHVCSPAHLLHIFRTPFHKNICRCLLL